MNKDNDQLSSIPNKNYSKFFAKFQEIDTLPLLQWKYQHFLGFFCRLYKQTYNIDYAWKYNTPAPSKCFEVWQFNTLCAKLSTQPQILKDYIDFFFQSIVPKMKKRFTSISAMTKDEVVNPYKMSLLGGRQDGKIDRNTILPTIYKEIVKSGTDRDIDNYGDLAFLHYHYFSSSPPDSNWVIVVNNLEQAGFDMQLIGRIV